MSPLHWAAFNTDLRTVQKLLEAKSDPYSFSWNKMLPIDIAGLSKSYDIVEAFLKHLDKNPLVIVTQEQEDINLIEKEQEEINLIDTIVHH